MSVTDRSRLVVEVLVVVQEMPDGAWVAYALADPALAIAGSGEPDLAELELALAEHLHEIPVDRWPSFSYPEPTELREVPVSFLREDLPEKARRLPPVAISCAVVPDTRQSWVMALPLRASFTLSPSEPFETTLSEEIRRFAAAKGLSPTELLELLPTGGHRLVRLRVAPERAGAAAARADRGTGAVARERREEEAAKTLASVGRTLETDAQEFVGRKAELRQLETLLQASQRRSVLLVGAASTGKSALVRRWLRGAQRAGRRPRVVVTSAADLLAGMSGFGEWQERLDEVMKAAETLDAVLYFESFEDLFSDHPSGHVDLPGAMKRYLDEDRVRVLGEATPEALDRAEARHPGFASLFHAMRIEPLSPAETAQALERRLEAQRDRGPTLDPAATPHLLYLVERYLPYESLPGKAIRLLDAVTATAARGVDTAEPLIPGASLFDVFSLRTGIPPFLLRDDHSLEAEQVADWFRQRLVGQEEAIHSVVGVICVLKAQLQPAGKPLATFLFAGPTGVGKTELAKAVARFLFGSEERLARFDMSEYQDPEAAERLIQGSDREDGLLTRRIRQQPFSVLLLDEIEKAHPAVFDLLLQVTGEARLSDARGRTAWFHNAILIMTSNLGTRGQDRQIGWTPRGPDAGVYERELRRSFRPEFLNRIDRVVPFRALTAAEAERVTALTLERLRRRPGLSEGGVSLDVSASALAELARAGHSDSYGARALRRSVEERVVAPLARLVARAGTPAAGAQARVTRVDEAETAAAGVFAEAEEGPLRLRLARGSGLGAGARHDDHSQLHAIAELRREVERWYHLDRVEQAGDELRQARVELMRVGQEAAGRTPPSERRYREVVERFQQYEGLFHQARAAQATLRHVEERALLRIIEESGESESLLPEARDAHRGFRAALLRLIVSGFPQRHAITLRLLLLDPVPARRFWLEPMLQQGRERGWSVALHVWERSGAGRRWGPPLGPEVFLAEDGPRHVLLRCRGEEAGSILTSEVGLHRYRDWNETGRDALFRVDRIALRSELSAEDWARPELEPMDAERALLRRAPAVREWFGKERRLEIDAGRRTRSASLEDYWEQIDDIALDQLLSCEDRGGPGLEALFHGPLDAGPADEDAKLP